MKPNVCEEQQLNVVELPHLCVQVFTHAVRSGDRTVPASEDMWVMKEGSGTTLCTDKCTARSPSTSAAPVGAGGNMNLAAHALSLQWGHVSMEGGAQTVRPSGASVQRVSKAPAVNMVLFSIFLLLWVCPVTFPCGPTAHPSSEDWEEPFGQGLSGLGRGHHSMNLNDMNPLLPSAFSVPATQRVQCPREKCIMWDHSLFLRDEDSPNINECTIDKGGCQNQC
ncbi:uncharacterized protein LOC109489339 isoform X2 [Ailuropoda melanoleuca]|uniref:uncharacterized protein LOC109489339 isoform X2 n=1 Tax=Ailuropoda melanoleuca TaxID=9646 RepID=UPI0014949954|nr:uncharacterized protein LOC109489339 isoform X2 [Ailuropoda melanoleuca]